MKLTSTDWQIIFSFFCALVGMLIPGLIFRHDQYVENAMLAGAILGAMFGAMLSEVIKNFGLRIRLKIKSGIGLLKMIENIKLIIFYICISVTVAIVIFNVPRDDINVFGGLLYLAIVVGFLIGHILGKIIEKLIKKIGGNQDE